QNGIVWDGLVADGVGFEPTVRLHARRFSRPLPSTARPPIPRARKLRRRTQNAKHRPAPRAYRHHPGQPWSPLCTSKQSSSGVSNLDQHHPHLPLTDSRAPCLLPKTTRTALPQETSMPLRPSALLLTTALLAALAATTAAAAADPVPDPNSTISIQWENNATRPGSDNYYTNGGRVAYTSPTGEVAAPLAALGHSLFGEGQQRFALELSQY